MTLTTTTDRLLLRTWVPQADAEAAFQIYSDPDVTRWLLTRAGNIAEAQAVLERWNAAANQVQKGLGFWAIVQRQTGEIVGTVVLMPLKEQGQWTEEIEIGWHLRRSAWGKGYATEAAQAIVRYGFETLGLTVIYAIARPENTASLRVMQRLGMVAIGRTKRYYNLELEQFKLERRMRIA